MKNPDLENDKINKLVNTFAIPCIISFIVASLYNIVDQSFIGWSYAWADWNAATNIVFPFVVIAMAFWLLFWDWMAALFNLSLWAKDHEKANKSIWNWFTLLFIFSIFISIIWIVFGEQILQIFWWDPNETDCYNYAKDYLRIISYWLPFYVIANWLNSIIRSDWSPRFAMITILAWMILNIILDPIFIFVLNLWVKWAAFATIISQFVTFACSIYYLTKPKQFKITKDSIELEFRICRKIVSLWMASLISQLTIVLIIAVTNNLIANYWAQTFATTWKAFGFVIPIAVIWICMKVFWIIMSIVIGFTVWWMPVIWYNMWAKKYARVKEAIFYILKINLAISIVALAIFQLFPTYIINIFWAWNSLEYQEYAKYCFKIFLAWIVFTCILKSISIILQSMWSSFKSTFIALSRDVFFFVPIVIIITTISGSVVTMLWSALIADILGFILAVVFLKLEFAKMRE